MRELIRTNDVVLVYCLNDIADLVPEQAAAFLRETKGPAQGVKEPVAAILATLRPIFLSGRNR